MSVKERVYTVSVTSHNGLLIRGDDDYPWVAVYSVTQDDLILTHGGISFDSLWEYSRFLGACHQTINLHLSDRLKEKNEYVWTIHKAVTKIQVLGDNDSDG